MALKVRRQEACFKNADSAQQSLSQPYAKPRGGWAQRHSAFNVSAQIFKVFAVWPLQPGISRVYATDHVTIKFFLRKKNYFGHH